jgi:hypothetical protein
LRKYVKSSGKGADREFKGRRDLLTCFTKPSFPSDVTAKGVQKCFAVKIGPVKGGNENLRIGCLQEKKVT